MRHRWVLAVMVPVAVVCAVAGGGLAVWALDSLFCTRGDSCDGKQFILPFFMASGLAGTAVLVATIAFLAPRSGDRRGALAVDMSRVAGWSIMVPGAFAFFAGLFAAAQGAEPFLVFGGLLMGLAGAVPPLARLGGRTVFRRTCWGCAAVATVLAVPTVLGVPFVTPYVVLLVGAARVAKRADPDQPPFVEVVSADGAR